MRIKTVIASGSLIMFGLILLLMSITIVPEGHVEIVTRWGKADRQLDPGLYFINPISESTIEIEVRQRSTEIELGSATANQLPITALVSMNWTVDKTQAMALFVKYGSIEQFESRIVRRRLADNAKAGLSQFQADQMIRDRALVSSEIRKRVADALATFPVSVDGLQTENIGLPERYMEAVLAKEEAREAASREEYKLAQQKLEAQRTVQTAEAGRDAAIATATGQAEAKRIEAEAEAFRVFTEYKGRAEGVALLRQELSAEYMDYLRAQSWNGVLPQTILGDASNVLFSVR